MNGPNATSNLTEFDWMHNVNFACLHFAPLWSNVLVALVQRINLSWLKLKNFMIFLMPQRKEVHWYIAPSRDRAKRFDLRVDLAIKRFKMGGYGRRCKWDDFKMLRITNLYYPKQLKWWYDMRWMRLMMWYVVIMQWMIYDMLRLTDLYYDDDANAMHVKWSMFPIMYDMNDMWYADCL